MSGRPRRACDKCNSQKLRCSGTRPRCQRCARLRRPCVYRPVNDGGDGEELLAQERPARTDWTRTSRPSLPIPTSLPEKSYLGIPPLLIPKLVDVYFSHIYNAALLIHKPTVLDAIATESLRADILLSVCAFAAKFHHDENGRRPLLDDGFAYEWAERAGRLAFQEAEFAKEDNVVSFMNLALFWYSEGEFRRSSMHEGNAVNTARTLGMSVERHGGEDLLEDEIRRRRFWATYLMSTFQSESLIAKIPSETTMKLSLPCRDEDFEEGRPRAKTSLQSSQRTGSIYAELITIMTLWCAVQVFVKQPEPNDVSRLADLQVLDARIREWWLKLPSDLHLNPLDLSAVPSAILPRLLLIHTVYHQCLCSLHSSIVPLFSWSASDDHYVYARQISGQAALDHANALSVLFRTALNHAWDASRLPSFIGYAAYCACAIQTPFMWCLNPVIKKQAHENVLTNLKTIHLVGKYWKFVELLGTNVRLLYRFRTKYHTSIADEPKNIDAAAMGSFGRKVPRARVSILTHNQILWGQGGGVARRADEVDLGLEDGNTESVPGDREGRIVDLISEISREGQEASEGSPVMLDVFPSYPDPAFDFYDLGGTFGQINNHLEANQIGTLEDWIGELMQEHS